MCVIVACCDVPLYLPACLSADCTTLEVQAGGRMFLFVAESAAAIRDWVQQLSLGREVTVSCVCLSIYLFASVRV